MLSNDMLAANSTWREIARLSRFAIHARGGCETMIKGMTVKNSGQLAVLCVLSQLLVLDLYGAHYLHPARAIPRKGRKC